MGHSFLIYYSIFLISCTVAYDTLGLDLIDGRACMTAEHSRSARNTSTYYECAPLSSNEMSQFSVKEKYLGIWTIRHCPTNMEFDESQQKCIEKRKLHRQPSQAAEPNCAASNANPIVGNQCNWLTASLQNDPSSRTHFLQCSITSPGEVCGEWIRMPCASNTVFEFNQQICVAEDINSNNQCGNSNNGSPICPCSKSVTTTTSTCPGISICISSVCCQKSQADPTTELSYQAPMCIGTGVAPIGACEANACPNNYNCQDGIGCCPNFDTGSNVLSVSVKVCPGTSIVPVGSCSNGRTCPVGTLCNDQVKSCCPDMTLNNNNNNKYVAVILCPNGKSPVGACNNGGCGNNQQCFKGSCCEQAGCPLNQVPQGFCNNGGCQGGATCFQSTCCQPMGEVIKLPICPNGQSSTVMCAAGMNSCGPGFYCSNGGCCPLGFCPNGIAALSNCPCLDGSMCLEGLCCPLSRCPAGELSSAFCSQNRDCGAGYTCENMNCCAMPQCPTGNFASQRCGRNTACPVGHTCFQGGCCVLPLCSSGIQSVSLCTASFQCGSGLECSGEGGCCSLPRCPSGVSATARCQMGACANQNEMCTPAGVCCPIPLCSTSQMIPASMCGAGNSCGRNQFCEGGFGCCPEPMPLCNNGARSTLRCMMGSDCPMGYGCTQLNVCCRLSSEPMCPQTQNAICQCSANNVCPPGSSCSGAGTCCSAGVTKLFIPGSTCAFSAQCQGFSNQGTTRCINQICSCTAGGYSNGVSCLRSETIRSARNACDQYGNECKYVLSNTRRKPLFTPLANVTDAPIWFNVVESRNCVMNTSTGFDFDPDSTCLPNEKCINGKCKTKLWPGEYGCSSNLECTARCENSYCESNSDKMIPQCLCTNGFLLYGRCVEHCPVGFHGHTKYCMHDDEEKFWGDSKLQDNLEQILNKGKC
uniref:Chitin-binding type-2 domain-containing protein n=1 Tax=Rhabditophanes sp. KR3021 TaxID=114890 RepID=A0AC35TJJ1_9BILA